MTMNKNISDPKGYYEIFGIDKEISSQEIKKLYREKAKYMHPDKTKARGAKAKFQLLNEAYDILKNENTKLIYDLSAKFYPENLYPEDIKYINLYQCEGYDDINLRVIKFYKNDNKESNLYEAVHSFKSALKTAYKYNLYNIFRGWRYGFFYNLKAIYKNILGGDNNKSYSDMMMVNNAIYYYNIGNLEKAKTCLKILNNDERIVKEFERIIEAKEIEINDVWKEKKYKFYLPYLLVILIVLVGSFYKKPYNYIVDAYIDYVYGLNNISEEDEYRNNLVKNGDKLAIDDLSFTKVFNLPINVSNGDLLYHLKKRSDIYHAPNSRLDIVRSLEKDVSVRLTGFIPGKKWVRILMDDGISGFIQSDRIEKGIGIEPPVDNKIYKKSVE